MSGPFSLRRPAASARPALHRTLAFARSSRMFSAEAALAVGVLVFLGAALWWVSADTRLADGDNAKHLTIAFAFADRLEEFRPLQPFLEYSSYPPLVHLVGAVASLLVGDATQATAVTASNLVFVPLLVIGCYGAGTVAYDRRVGLLAALFALAAPMVIGLSHVFMLDLPLTALAAVSIWLLLLSDRFEREGVAALAGVAVAAGFYAKSTFPLFIAGLVLVMLIRGGWRHWRGFALFSIVVLLLIQPWYLQHFESIRGQTNGGVATGVEILWYDNVPYPDKWELGNYTWYAWNLVNNQLYLPLLVFFAVGLAFALWRWLGRRAPDRYTPELIVGGFVGYLGVSYLNLDDPRYNLPCLLYIAVLGTAWIVRLKPRWLRAVPIAALLLIFALNLSALTVGKGYDKAISLPGAVDNSIGQRKLAVASTSGYTGGAPDRNGYRDVFVELLARAHRDGTRKIIFEPDSLNNGGFNLFSLPLIARAGGVTNVLPVQDAAKLGPNDLFIFRRLPEQVDHAPCLKSFDDTAIFMYRGGGLPEPTRGKYRSVESSKLYCPSGGALDLRAGSG